MPRKRKTASGASGQPIRDIPGGTYGDRQAATEQQQAVPLPAAESPPSSAGAGAGGRPPPAFGPSAFRASERPGEPIQSGIPLGPGTNGQNQVIPTDTTDSFIRALYSHYPSEALLRLLRE